MAEPVRLRASSRRHPYLEAAISALATSAELLSVLQLVFSV